MTKVKIRGYIWKQITEKEYKKLGSNGKLEHIAIFCDSWGEDTYFKEIINKSSTHQRGKHG